jgi:hypothetical protein
MAKLEAFRKFDLLALDLSFCFVNAVRSSFEERNVQVNGITYSDLIYVNGSDATRNLVTASEPTSNRALARTPAHSISSRRANGAAFHASCRSKKSSEHRS